MHLIKAFKKDKELIDEMDSLVNDAKNFYLWWLGQSGFLLQWKGKRVLMDPYLSDSLTKKYASTDKPHVRMSERVIDPELLKNILIVSSSHNHTDHLDAETLIPIFKDNPGIKFIKDVSAAAVLLSAATALITGAIIFLPKLLA